LLKDFVGGGSGVPLIGGEVLRRFTIVFEFQHQRMFLEPNRHFSEPITEDRSGLVLRWAAERSAFLAHDVSPDSPASQAGLQKGDQVIAIDGCPATAFRLDRVQRLLRQDNKSVTFTVRRQGSEIPVRLKTRSLFSTNSQSH
jgi:C-terminal processing protease CtpA/Prc